MDKRGKRYLVLGAQGITLSALVIGTVAFVGADKTVALTVDGSSRDVQTFGHTVSDVLAAGGVSVDGNDALSSPLDATVSDGDRIDVRLARPVTVTVDGRERTVDTAARTVGELTDQLGVDDDSRLSMGQDIALAAAGTPLSVTTPKHVTVDVAGKRHTLETTALDVEELLGDLGVDPDGDDLVSPAANSVVADGMKVSFTDVRHRKVTSSVAVKHQVKKVEDSSLAEGRTETTTDGEDGERTTVYDVLYRNGKEVKRSKTSGDLTRKPVTEIVRVGTKADEATSAATEKKDEKKETSSEKDSKDSTSSESSGTSEKKASTTSSGSVSGVWQKLAQCESGGNWAANTGNGYYGGLQFTASTWAAQGGTKYAALPSQATAAEQVAIASKLQKAAGWGQWPACTSQLGLR